MLHSRKTRAAGGQQPLRGDLASTAQSLAAANERGDKAQAAATSTGSAPGNVTINLSSAEQSQLDKEANHVQAADKVVSKMANEPGSVTKEDGDLLHSRETRAFGATEKGGIASKAQSLASENAGDKKA